MEFAIRRPFMKICDTRSKDNVLYCMKMFNVQNPYHDITKRKCKFLQNNMSSANLLCQICKDFAEKEWRGILVQTVRNNYCFCTAKFLFNLI